MSLGIFKRIWTLLEESCTELDLELSEHVSGGDFGNSFESYVAALKRTSELKPMMEKLNSTATLLEQILAFALVSTPNPAITSDLSTIREKATRIRTETRVIVSIIITRK